MDAGLLEIQLPVLHVYVSSASCNVRFWRTPEFLPELVVGLRRQMEQAATYKALAE